NHIDITQKCLLSVMNTEFDGSAEIIIVDNGSTDGTAEWLKSFQDKYDSDECRIVLVLNKYNRGCTGGRNQACRDCAADEPKTRACMSEVFTFRVR
ncbi:MAG: glycosyltransferase, partial [Lachnospiraceae bacterium]|nr:glycosyltransferase [Lachnospiraceae bacterium]